MGVSANHLKEVLILRNKHVSISSYLFKIDVLHHVISSLNFYRCCYYLCDRTDFTVSFYFATSFLQKMRIRARA